MPTEYAKTLGAKLRAIRQQQGLSLHGVEEKSKGRWKAVVVGSYERGDRAVTVQSSRSSPSSTACRSGAAARVGPFGCGGRAARRSWSSTSRRLRPRRASRPAPLSRYTATIQAQRGDYNGKVLSIRQDDLRTLAVIYDERPSVLADRLVAWGVLNADAAEAVTDEE